MKKNTVGSEYQEAEHQVLMDEELRKMYEKGGVGVVDFPTSSGKSFKIRRLHKILNLHPEQKVILACGSKEQCEAAMADLKGIEGVIPLRLRGQEDQIQDIYEKYWQDEDKKQWFCAEVARILMACKLKEEGSTVPSATSDFSKDDIENIFNRIFIRWKWNQKEKAPKSALAAEQRNQSGYPDFKMIYQWLYRAKKHNIKIPKEILESFEELKFDESNFIVVTHAKCLYSLLSYKSYYLTSLTLSNKKEKNPILVIDEVESFCSAYNEKAIIQAKKSANDLIPFAYKVVQLAKPKHNMLDIYVEKAEKECAKYHDSEHAKELQEKIDLVKEQLQIYRDTVAECTKTYRYDMPYEFVHKQKNPPVFTAVNGGLQGTGQTLYCNLDEKSASVHVSEERGESTSYTLREFVYHTNHMLNVFFGLLRRLVNLMVTENDDYNRTERDRILRNIVREINLSGNESEEAFIHNSVFPEMVRQQRPEKLGNEVDWYENGIARYFTQAVDGNYSQLHIGATRIPRTASAFIANCAQRLSCVFLMSATIKIRAINGPDLEYIRSKGIPVYEISEETRKRIQKSFNESRKELYPDAVPNVKCLVIHQPEFDGNAESYRYAVTKYMLKEYMNWVIRWVKKSHVTDGYCVEAILSSHFKKKDGDPDLIKVSELEDTEGLNIVFFQLDSKGVREIRNNHFIDVGESDYIEKDLEHPDTYTLVLPKYTVGFLMTAYRSGERSYNVDIRTAEEPQETYSLGGIYLAQMTNIVPGGQNLELEEYAAQQSSDQFDKFITQLQMEMNAEYFLLAMFQYRMTYGQRKISKEVYKKINFYTNEKSKYYVGRGYFNPKNDLYSEDDGSAFKMTGFASYLQGIGRLRNGKRPKVVLMAISDKIIKDKQFLPEYVESYTHPYEAELLANHIEENMADILSMGEKRGRVSHINEKLVQEQLLTSDWKIVRRMKEEIPELKKAYMNAASEPEKAELLHKLQRKIQDQETMKEHAVDFLASYQDVPTIAETKEVKVFPYVVKVKLKNKTREKLKPFTAYSYLDLDKSTKSRDVKAIRIAMDSEDVGDVKKLTPRREYLDFGCAEEMRILKNLNPEKFREQFPLVSEETLKKMERLNRFPYPISYQGWCTVTGEIGERVFAGIVDGRSDLEFVPSKEYPQCYEDFDFYVIKDGEIVGAVNVKNVVKTYREESTLELRRLKAERMRRLPDIKDPDHLRVVYINLMPARTDKKKEKDSFKESGMESLELQLFSKGTSPDAMERVSIDIAGTMKKMEDFFDGKYTSAE